MGEGRKRKTIGFISQTGYDNFPTQMLGGATKAAREHDVNLIRFSMESTRLEDSYQDQLEYILRIIANADLDGLMFLGWMYDFQKDPKAFFGKFEKDKKTPLVCVGSIMDGVPSVGMDGRKYMIELLAHLAEHHSYKNIVFIQPYSPDDRYPAYEEYMKKHGFFKPELVITREEIMIHGDHYAHVRAKKICNILFDERKLEFDALISPFAHEAASILEESMRRGYRIPDDFAVIGWEDGARSKYADPAITSMYFPFFEIGYAACEKMVQIISGEKVPFVTLIPTRLNIRKSCGCNPTDILSECGDLPNKRNKNPTKEELIRRFHSRADISLEALDPEIMINMLFQNKTDENESINRYLNQLLAKASITVHSITMINMIQKDILRFSCFIRQECENETLAWTAERLAYRILAAIHQKMERELGFNEALNRGESHLLQGINQDIVTTFGLDQLLKVIVEGLGKINIKNCFLFLNPDPAMAALEERSVYRFQNGVMSDITQGLDEKFNILSALFPEDRQSIYYFYILHIKQKLIGFMAIEPHQIDEQIYFSLSVQISSALHESNTMQSLEKTIRSLETAKNKISENLTVIQQKTSQLEDSNRKLSRLDQLKNDFIANVTHDFRSPLMVILNLADLSIKYYDEMDDRLILDRLQTVFNASERLKDTVDRLLEIAKMDASAMELHIRNLPLRAYIKNISDFYKSAAAASSIEIIAQLPKHEIDDFYTDPEKLDEIVNNIISNAIKFVDPMSGKILIKVIDGEKHVRLVIEDNGIGIPPDKLETIFNRFKQLEGGRTAKHKGSGIGLAFARQAAASLEGTLKAESDGPGKGARFILKFPKGIDVFKHSDGKIIFDPQEGKISNDKRSQYKHLIESGLHESRERREVQVIMNSPRSEDRSDPSRVLILIIDENPAITKIVREYLSRAGYGNFIIASCASDGLEAVSRFKPDLIISDCSIPLATGREFHQELLDNPELLHTPIIFLSANAGKRLSPEEKKRGTFVYLQKPVDGKELLLKVEQFLAEKHGSS